MSIEELALRLNPVPGGRCLLGLSGGADSVALLRMLLPLREAGTLFPEAVHVNHGLRGEESDGDQAFTEELCGRLKVPLHAVRLDLGGRRDENAAREARYAAFFRIMKEREIPALILAHQREDQAETLMMRLLRGAGPEGLEGMRPLEERNGFRILRPMLDISGAELREALRGLGQPWREDGTNRQDLYLRNRIRKELLPRMEEMVPGAVRRLARTAGLIAEENDAMAEAAEKLLRAAESPEGLDAGMLKEAPAALRKRALRRWWREKGPRLDERELSYEQTGRLAALTDAPRGTIINLPAGWRARREKTHIRLLDPTNRTKNNRPKGGTEGKP